MKNDVLKITFTGIMLALAVVLSSFCQIKLFSDIRLDMSYMVITVMCYAYGGLVGTFFAGGIALMNSLFFSAYGVSISWISANMIIGLISGLVLHYVKIKHKGLKITIDLLSILLSCAIGLLLTKTLIECHLYEIPFEIKIAKNLVAFTSDAIMMIIGYFTIVPLYKKIVEKKHYLEY